MPPPWASSRIKLNQMFYKHQLDPPVDLIGSASFLVTLSFLRERAALAFVARTVARWLEREGLAQTLPVKLPFELPPVGIITLRSRAHTPACALLMDCLRQTVPSG